REGAGKVNLASYVQKRHTMESRGHELQIGAIVRRLERLEWESRRWKVVAMLMAVTLGMVLFIGAGKNGETSVPSELQARAFVLVDCEGPPLAGVGLLAEA